MPRTNEHARGKKYAAKPRIREAALVQVEGEMCVEVVLANGAVAVIDKQDFLEVGKHLWHTVNGYAAREGGEGESRTVFLHRMLCPVGHGSFVDHINGNKLDNRRKNLRPATKMQNAWNAKISRRNSSGVKGVKRNRYGRWTAEIKCAGRYRYLGIYRAIEDAAAARSSAEAEMFGEYRRAG